MAIADTIAIANAQSGDEIATVRGIFVEYAKWIGISLEYQHFDDEVASLPGKYAPPHGRLLLARVDGVIAGCGALRQIDGDVCEMKRVYVRPEFRGSGIGGKIIDRLIEDARAIGYRAMRLDTIGDKMGDAIRLYRRIGFHEIAAYYEGAPASTIFMELKLRE